MKKLMIGTSILAMTAAELATGRYMRAPDGHGDGGDGGGAPPAPAPEPEPEGGEINDDPLRADDNEPGERQPPAPAPEDDSGEPPEEGDDGDASDPKSVAARIGEKERLRREAERLADENRRDAEYWRGRFDGTINEDGSPVTPEGGSADEPEDDGRPKPEDYQYGETDAGYIRDLARFEARAAYEEREQEAAVQRQLGEVESNHASRVEKAKETYPDYEELVIQGANVDPGTGKAKWDCSPLLALAIKTSEYGPHVAHALASNPEESRRIAQLPVLEQAKEFGRLEYQAEQKYKPEGDGQQGKPPQASNTPPPPPRARGAGGVQAVKADTDDFDEFEEMADAHLKTKKRR